MKKHAVLSLLLALVPVAALALDFEHSDDRYTDADLLSIPERAAVSALTDIGAVSGNPDGSFAPDRTLNRAEFTKIAVEAAPDGRVLEADEAEDTAPTDPWCFPDVRIGDWFSPYICAAKQAGIVAGNPDGLFHPERAVNYAEAAKILVEIFEYDLPEPPENERWTWYRAYLLAAEEHGVSLPTSVEPDHELTRGQMARLAAAFVAERAGVLDEYRRAERGQFGSASSSSSAASSVSSVSTAVSSASVSSSSSSRASSSSVALFPAKNSFLVAGKMTPLILGGPLVSSDESSLLRIVRLVLRREIVSISRVFLVDENGQEIAELKPATYDNSDDRKWEALTPESTFAFPADTPVKIGLRFDLFPKDGGGASNQLVEVESFTLQSEGSTTGNTKYLLLDDQVYPIHQTTFGRLTQAKSVLPSTGTLQAGEQRQIASLFVTAETATGASIFLRSAEFLLSTTDVAISNIRIGDASSGQLMDCGLEKLGVTRIICSSLPEGRSWVPPEGLVVSLYADVQLSGNGNGQMTIAMEGRGRIGDAGSFVWGDDSGQFNWIEEGVPFGGDVSWTVMP